MDVPVDFSGLFLGAGFAAREKRRNNELSQKELEKLFEDLKGLNPRKAAEVAYALAFILKKGGDMGKAVGFGRECVRIFDLLEREGKLKTMEDCACRFSELGGVLIPELIHEEVARTRLRELGLDV